MGTIKIKRIYEEASPDDGYRILVDRLWPRGIKKEEAAIEEWKKELAPSSELRKWFNHQPELFPEFTKRYKAELKKQTETLHRLKKLSDKQNITLLYSAKDELHNQAQVILKALQELK